MSQSPVFERLSQALQQGALSRREVLRLALGAGAFAMLPGAIRAQSRSRFVDYPFQLGVASGYPTPDGFTLWTRLAPSPLADDGGMGADEQIEVRWEVAEDVHFGTVVRSGKVIAVGEHAHSVHADVDGLAADRWYYFRFIAGGEVSVVGRTRTAPATGAAVKGMKFGLGSCQHFEQGWFNAYPHLIADAPDLMCFVGDYIYESSWGDDLVRRHARPEPYSLIDYRARYAQYKTDPGLQAAHAAMPWIVTWDDHEVDNDWAGSQSERLDPRFLQRRAAAFQAFVEHMPLPASIRRSLGDSLQLYTQCAFGGLANFFVLDDRQYRNPQPCPDEAKGGGSTVFTTSDCPALDSEALTMLGDAQERWLGQQLKASRAQWNVVVQQTLVSPMDNSPAAGNQVWTDGWDGYPVARRRLLEQLARPTLRNPLVIGGDVHAAVVCDVKRDARADSMVVAAEVCGTSIASQGWPQAHYDELRPVNPHLQHVRSDQRGYALFELNRKDAQVALRVVESVKQPESPISTQARFHMEDGVRGIRPA